MEWILYSNVRGLYLSWKDSDSNPFGKIQVCVYITLLLQKKAISNNLYDISQQSFSPFIINKKRKKA